MEYKDSREDTINSIKSLNIKLPQEFKDKFVNALRSGEYKQSQGCLMKIHNGESMFCCLGVAAHICGVNLHKDGFRTHDIIPDPNALGVRLEIAEAFKDVPNELAGSQQLQTLLYHLNDSFSCSFAEIADVIEKYL